MSGDLPDRQEKYFPEINEETIEPPDYKVLLHNDDYTIKAFVIDIGKRIGKPQICRT